MTTPERKLTNTSWLATFVFAVFFLSGVAALIYEASWSRQIGLAVGHTAQAAALVLAAFFAGMAIGQFLGGRLASRVSPLFGYGVAELIVAVWACFVPGLLDWVGTPAGTNVANWFRDAPSGRSAMCFLTLLPVTVPLGATLPFVVEIVASGFGSRRQASFAYGLNTAGGVVGIVTATAFLMVVVGVRASGFLAAAVSAACGVTACAVAILQRDRSVPKRLGTSTVMAERDSWQWIVVAAISGFGTLGLEVLYTRMFALIFHNSTYTFGAVVAVFLLALSFGAALASRLGKRFRPRQIATMSFSLGSVALAVSVVAFPQVTGLNYFAFGETFTGYLTGVLGVVAVFVLPPVTLFGMTLPSAFHAASGTRAIGFLTATNTISGAIGAIATGFFLPQGVGLWPAFGAFVVLFGFAGVILLILSGNGRFASIMALSLTLLVAVVLSGASNGLRDTNGDEVVRRWESDYGWVDVIRSRKGSLAVRQNHHYRHGSTEFAIREYRQGRLPLLLHPEPSEVAFLGLGTGMTVAPVVEDAGVENAVVIELIPEVVEAARLLASSNRGVVDHSKVEIHIADARHHMLRTNRQFDVIVSDLFVPWESRTGYLYTVEFYESVRRRLKPGGLFCQWIALYQLGPEQFELIADSLSSVFPNTTIWWGQFDAERPIVALIGSEQILDINSDRVQKRLDVWNGLSGWADPELRIPADVPAFYLGDWIRNTIRQRNTDEHPWLEFTAPISHRSGRTLQRSVLRNYFDRVFTRLPSGGVHFGGELNALKSDDIQRRAIQRLSLFGDIGP